MHRRMAPAGLLFLAAAVGSVAAEDRGKGIPGFRVDVNTVVLPVSVSDSLNRYVVGLEKEHFKVFENKVEQTITHFSGDRAPLSVGMVLDVSGSMQDNVASARNALARFLEKGDPADEYFLITFNERSTVLQDFTARSGEVRNEVAISAPKGRTALYDALYLGMEKIRQAQQGRKALIVITDGEDNSSRYTFSEVKAFALESDAQIYIIGEQGELGFGRSVIAQIAGLTGGRAFFPRSFKQLEYFVDLIHTELRHQYLLGYVPTGRSSAGSWREIKVVLQAPEGLPPLKVRAREGYFAPQQ